MVSACAWPTAGVAPCCRAAGRRGGSASPFPSVRSTHASDGSERFPRSRRLARATEVRRVLTTGHRLRRPHFDIFWTSNETGFPRLGLVVAKAQETGVGRNRLRRRVKEVWRRELQQQLPAWDVVVRTNRKAYVASFEELRGDLTAWCKAAVG